MAPSSLGTQHPQIVDVYDASHVWRQSNPNRSLWVGAKPPVDRSYPNIDMIVLCAREYQPPALPHFKGPLVRVAIPDEALDTDELRRALAGGAAVAEALSKGKRVLVTCAAGINRSALVASLALVRHTKMTADECVALMRAKRHPDCLFNTHFVEILKRYAPPKR